MAITLEKLSEGKFWGHFYRKATLAKTLFSVSFELTHNCNLSCCHCYIPQREIEAKGPEELSYYEVCSILDELVGLGCFNVDFTGGEIFTRPDIMDILEYAKTKGLYVTVLTNATLITSQIASGLGKIGINRVGVSLYGMNRKVHESITGVEGSFEKCIEGISLLKERGIRLSLKAMIMNLNSNEIDSLKAFARRLNMRFQYDYLIHPRLDGSKEPLRYRLLPEEVLKLTQKDRKLNDSDRDFHKGFKKGFFYCRAGKNSATISPCGEMNLCLQYPYPKYNLRKGSVGEAWEELREYVDSERPAPDYECSSCEVRKYCNWCPADGFLECGNRSACVPYLKDLAEARRREEKNAKGG
jgi:radical SAM protein with 4Fe4S-binding SPASM domain